MPIYHDIIREIQEESLSPNPGPQDRVRRKYLHELQQSTGRDVILYASAFTSAKRGVELPVAIFPPDLKGFMSALKDLSGDKLDLIIHSPGGQAETTEQLVNYLRKKYSHIRAIVPQNAMSAATMLACAADEIVMGKHSALGPIDPQFRIDNQSVPAQAILDEFQTALDEIAKGAKPTLWIKRLEGLTPGFLKSCENAIELSRDLVRLWLSQYMFADDPQGDKKAYSIAEWLGAHANFKTHGRPIGIDMASEKGLKVLALEEDQAFQEAVLSVFHAAEATFETTSCFKIIENHLGSGMYYTSKEK